MRPDLGGDFEDPGGLIAIDIDPATGMVAKNGSPNPRHELFIEGTQPSRKEPENGDDVDPMAEPPKPPPASSDSEKMSTRPRQVMPQVDEITLRHTLVFEVCADTGLIPTENVCSRTTRRRFKLGQEPYQFCTKAAHQKRGL